MDLKFEKLTSNIEISQILEHIYMIYVFSSVKYWLHWSTQFDSSDLQRSMYECKLYLYDEMIEVCFNYLDWSTSECLKYIFYVLLHVIYLPG